MTLLNFEISNKSLSFGFHRLAMEVMEVMEVMEKRAIFCHGACQPTFEVMAGKASGERCLVVKETKAGPWGHIKTDQNRVRVLNA